jgi:hypothetical protein
LVGVGFRRGCDGDAEKAEKEWFAGACFHEFEERVTWANGLCFKLFLASGGPSRKTRDVARKSLPRMNPHARLGRSGAAGIPEMHEPPCAMHESCEI